MLATKISYILFGASPLISISVFFLLLTSAYLISKRFKNNQVLLFVFSIIPLILWAIRLMLNDYFLSDDFDHFALVLKYSFGEIFVKGITADNIWAFHRLFTAFIAFKFLYVIFGTNYDVFVIFNFLLHAANIYLFVLILKKFIKDNYLVSVTAFITSLFYLTWISNIHELMAAFFFLLCLHLLITNKNTFLVLITYSLGVFSKEVVFLLPICYLLLKPKYIIKESKRHKTLIVLFCVYSIIFVFDYLKLSQFEKGSGYDTSFNFMQVFEHFKFYLNQRIYSWLFIFIPILYDVIKRKFILTPFLFSYVLLILPVLFLSKATVYYTYIPFFFLAFIIGYLLNNLKKKSVLATNILLSILLVFIFNAGKVFQENIFLIQFPRIHPRETAMNSLIQKINKDDFESNNLNSDEKSLYDNGYYKYFIK